MTKETTMVNAMKPQAPDTSLARSASIGMVWVTIALVFSKVLSFLSQIILGYALSVETYALFGISMTCVALIAGFQSPSVSKALIQNKDRFEELFPDYSAFAFQLGCVGSVVLIILAAAFHHIYEVPDLFAVLCVTSLSVPLLASNTTLNAGLSTKLRFRDLNIIEIKRSLFYYGVLISAALLGAEGFTMAIALVCGAIAAHIMLRYQNTLEQNYILPNIKTFFTLFYTLRWVLLAAFLTALAMRSDFLVLGKMLPLEQIGYYSFGFMLMTSLTIPISTGITQVLLPVFAQIQDQIDRMRQEVLRFSSAIIILGSTICIIILGLGSILVDLLWDGKWNDAQFLICLLALAMPFRFLATMSGVGLEALGKWRLRNGLLLFEAILLSICAALGAHLAGLHGAVVGAVAQRLLSGLVGFTYLARCIGQPMSELFMSMLRIFAPFLITSGSLLVISPERHGADGQLATAALETCGALVIFCLLSYWLNKPFVVEAANLIIKRIKKR